MSEERSKNERGTVGEVCEEQSGKDQRVVEVQTNDGQLQANISPMLHMVIKKGRIWQDAAF